MISIQKQDDFFQKISKTLMNSLKKNLSHKSFEQNNSDIVVLAKVISINLNLIIKNVI